MFFCNPWSDNEDNSNGGPIKFPFLMDYEKFPWLRGSETTPGLKSSNSSSTDDSFFEMEHDFPMDTSTDRIVFHDAVSLEDNKIFRSRKRRRRSSLSMVFLSCFLLLASLGVLMMIIGDSCKAIAIDYYASTLEAFRDVTIWFKSSTVRIWDEAPALALVTQQINFFLGTMQKIDTAIWSLFQWDEVDDAIVDWTKQTFLFVGKEVLDTTNQAVALVSSSALMETLARSILRAIIEAPGAQQALALLDFVQDVEP